MGKFQFHTTSIDGVRIVEPNLFGDNRGYFMETYNLEEFKAGGIDAVFVQDNQSKSRRGVLRGLHFQKTFTQAKLVRVISGEVFDVAVDLRKGSATYGKWEGIVISAENKKQFFVPKGFAHGFLVLSEEAEFCYKCDDFYHPEEECGLRWDDEVINIDWPQLADVEIVLSEKDCKYPSLAEAGFEL